MATRRAIYASSCSRGAPRWGWIANVLVGIVGSSLGFWIAGLLGIMPVGGFLHFVIAVAGAAPLIAILGAIGVFRR